MLVLTRKQSETIRIGESITITVLKMKGKSVRLGIEAPHHLTVIRGELAFEKCANEEVLAEAEEIDEETLRKPVARASNRSQHPSGNWPTRSQATVGCAAATWSI